MINIVQKSSYYRFKLMTKAYNKWLKKNEKVLDIGCGKGVITRLLTNYYSLQMQACDIKNYLTDKSINFSKINNNKLPKFKHRFDTAFLNDVLHHISKDKQINLILDVLKIADKVLIFEMKPTLSAKIFDILLNKLHYGDLNTPLSFRQIDGWKKLFKELNIKSEVTVIDRPFFYPFSHMAFKIWKK